MTAAAFVASSPYDNFRPLARWVTTPADVVHSEGFTPQVLAAAATSIARPAAPTRRIGTQLVGVAVLPPADCLSNFDGSNDACSTRTFFHSTSSSSAMSMGSIVLTP